MHDQFIVAVGAEDVTLVELVPLLRIVEQFIGETATV
jgi:hypothetical protein